MNPKNLFIMAGGKETPRQKMIGMMYLVLTALLALNVSKAVLDAFVAIEDNMQKAAITQHVRGNGFIVELNSAHAEAKGDPTMKAKAEKIEYYMEIIQKIDNETGTMIKMIDDLKINLLKESGEAVEDSDIKNKDKDAILWTKYSKSKDQLLPSRMNLMAVEAKDQYDKPMAILCGTAEGGDIKSPKGEGMKLWNAYNGYRSKLCELLATYKSGDKSFTFKPSAINQYKDKTDLLMKIRKMMTASGQNVNMNEDKEVLEQLYSELSKLEKSEVHDITDVHWIGKTFDHSPLVAALASLTNMQQEILSARATAVGHLKSKVTTGEFSFNMVTSLATGDAVVNQGGDIEIKVMMAAYDSDNQPIVTVKNPGATVSVANGQGTVKMRASGSGGPITLSGTVAIMKKSGVKKELPWTKDVIVMTPTGTVSLPNMNVLYRGYNNVVEGVASGYATTNLIGSGLKSLTKNGAQWIAKPGTGRTCKITVSGKTGDGVSANLGTYEFRVMNLPPPALYLGTIGNGQTVSAKAISSMTKLFTKYPPGIPLDATFSVGRYEIKVSGAPRPATGVGKNLSSDAKSLLKQVKKGDQVIISAKYNGMGYSGNVATVINVK
jgi:gliding motility-associated protein GldM